MSKRNFILLIIILGIALVVLFGFFYFNRGTVAPGEDDGGTNFFSNLNPFRRDNSSGNPPVVTPPPTGTGDVNLGGEVLVPKLKKVSSMPISGYASFKKERYVELPPVVPPPVEPAPEDGTPPKTATPPEPIPPPTEFVTALRYVDRATGNIFQTFADKIDERKFSSTLIPMVYEAFVSNGGQSVLMRYLKTDDTTIETFFGNLPKELLGADTASESNVTGSFLPQNITDLSISPDSTKAFYLFNTRGETTDIATGVILDTTKNTKTQIFNSPFTEWLTQWPNGRMITLTTKPSYATPGHMYAIDPGSTSSTRGLTKILGNVNGLTTLTAPDGKHVLYADSSLSLVVYNTDTGVATSTGVRTMPEKCVWSKASELVYCAVPAALPAGQYPDSWYRGEISFGDQIWRIDTVSGGVALLAVPTTVEGGEDIDGIKLSLDADEHYLFFVNKKNSFLWELDLR